MSHIFHSTSLLGNTPHITYSHYTFVFISVIGTGETSSQSLYIAVIVLGIVLFLTIAGTSFLIFRRWRCLQVNNSKTRTEQQHDIALPDGEPNAVNSSEETEQTSYFELRSVGATQGQSTTEHHYQQLQLSTKSPVYDDVIIRKGVYEEVGKPATIHQIFKIILKLFD